MCLSLTCSTGYGRSIWWPHFCWPVGGLASPGTCGSRLLSSHACVRELRTPVVAPVTVTLEEPLRESNPGPQAGAGGEGTVGWREGGRVPGTLLPLASSLGTLSPGSRQGASRAQLSLAPPSRTKFSFSSWDCCLGWSQECFPKSDSLLLLAKLYLIQWVFPCTVDVPNVINFNIKESCELCCLATSLGCCVGMSSLSRTSVAWGILARGFVPLPLWMELILGPESLWFICFCFA